MMAGIAISPLLNIKGDVAMAIACAAFCIPTSITIVRRTAASYRKSLVDKALNSIVVSISIAAAKPSTVKFAIISLVYWIKNTNAKSIKAGNAALPSPLFTFEVHPKS